MKVVIVITFILLASCSSFKKSYGNNYSIFMNDPKIFHVFQPWPLDQKAERKFQYSSQDIADLFKAENVEATDPEANQLFYDKYSKLAGQMREEREELIVLIRDLKNAEIFLDRANNAWKNGIRLNAQPNLVKNIIEELNTVRTKAK